jgi:hypothetical protein
VTELRKMDIRFDIRNVRSKVGSLMTVSEEMSTFKLDVVGVQIIWDRSGIETAENTFFYEKRNENHGLG